MLLIRKYIVKEILLYFVAIIFFLFLIFITNKFIGLLTKAASGQLPFAMVCQAMLLYVPEILGLLMPLSLFIAVLFVVSKLYADQEIVVLFTSGLNWYFLINTVIRVAVFVAILTAAITLWLAPYATKIREEVLSKGKTLGIISSVVPGRFQVINDGKQVFYVGNVDNKNQNNKIQDIFIATNADNQLETLVVTAKSGSIETLKDQDGNFLVLQDGHRYSGIAGNANFSVIDFAEYGRQLLPKDDESPLSMHKVQKTNEIWGSKIPGENAEWQWRMAMPISILILAMLAVSLAKVLPRQGKFAKFLPAILMYIIYCNAMIFMRRLIENEDVSAICGIWSVHLLFLVVTGFLLLQASGWFLYFRKKFLY